VKNTKRKIHPAPPLLCWDIYAEWLNKKLKIAPTQLDKTPKKKKQGL
jgi:hypothetical protein